MNPSESTIMIVGAGRGLGRGVADACAETGADVVRVSRTPGPGIEVADAADPATPARLLDRHRPDAVVLVAGAMPPSGPLQSLTWDQFSVNWHADVGIAFEWLRTILNRPLEPGSRVVVFSSGAALAGSPVS